MSAASGGARNPGEEVLAVQAEALEVEQPSAPYLDALVAVGFRGSTRFHVPGHKGGPGADPGLRHAIGDDALALDLPQDIEGIDAGPGPTPYVRAEQLAAQAHGAGRTWFLTNGATQGNHALCLALAGPGRSVVLQRNSHASLIDGLVLSGGIPTFVAAEVEEGLGMAHGVAPEALEAALELAPTAEAAFVVSPSYYGMAADVAGLADVAHAAETALVVDQAWGPHFGFHPGVPPSALALGADAVLTSTHKIVGSLTQSAMLHVAGDGRVDPERLARAVRLVRSTSPSALLLGSLDAARRQLAVHGEALLERTLHAAGLAVAAIDAVPGVRVIGDAVVGTPGVADRDPLRIVIDVRGTGCTGYEVAAALVAAYDVKVELAAHAVIVLVLGLDQPVVALERFAHDFEVIVRRLARPGERETVPDAPAGTAGTAAVSPRDAFLGPSEAVPVAEAIGRISCEAIAGYPPGIPALLPGDRIAADVVAYLRELVDVGARLHGASDASFQTLRVRCE
ncbi:MAG TPA: aminotransferase class I/II-fold pyridoxal phosphate-dependent enzyme [Solirubrobacteraceae bacterium]|nr:aminotransferase class I/II-fold pyridoxal phosphate-dependent enzyme [Solirubrobacteraceae bacterium]